MKDCGVPQTTDILTKTKTSAFKETKQKDLTPEQHNNLKKAITLVTENYAEPGTIKIGTGLSEAYGASEGVNIRGLYNPQKDEITLERTVLDNLEKTVHVLLHEVCHKVSKASDCTAEFETALCNIAVGLLMKLA